jgi:hypothetical protein
MAITQSQADKGGVAQVNETVSGLSVMRLGNIHLATGAGTPVAGAEGTGDMVASPKGSIYINVTTGKWHIKTSAADASSVWVVIGSIES